MNNVFVNSILAITGMAVVIALGILNLVATESHGMTLGLVGLVLIVVFLGVLTVLYNKKPPTAWAALVAGTLVLPHRRPASLHLQHARLHVGLRQDRLPLNRALKKRNTLSEGREISRPFLLPKPFFENRVGGEALGQAAVAFGQRMACVGELVAR